VRYSTPAVLGIPGESSNKLLVVVSLIFNQAAKNQAHLINRRNVGWENNF